MNPRVSSVIAENPTLYTKFRAIKTSLVPIANNQVEYYLQLMQIANYTKIR